MKHLFWTALLAVALLAPGHLLAESAPKPLAFIDVEALSAEEARTTADAVTELETRLESRLRTGLTDAFLNDPLLNGDAYYLGSAGVVFVVRTPFMLTDGSASDDSSDDLWEQAQRELAQNSNANAERTARIKTALMEALQNADWDVETLGPATAVAVGAGHSTLTVRKTDKVSARFDTLESSPVLKDAATMARVLEKTAGADGSVHNIRGIPIEGFGVLFAADAGMPLSPPSETNGGQASKNAEARRLSEELGKFWRSVFPEDLAVRPFFPLPEELLELDIDFDAFQLRRGDFFPPAIELPRELEAQLKDIQERMRSLQFNDDAFSFSFAGEYDAERVEALTARLMESLKHGARLRLDPSDAVAVSVRGAPALETTKEETHESSDDGVQYRSSVTILSGHGFTDTFMALRVSKDAIDRLASGETTLAELKNEARVVTGLE